MERRAGIPKIAEAHVGGYALVHHSKYLIEIADNTKTFRKRSRHVLLITGPTGAGKDTLISQLPSRKFVRWRTWTTRTQVRPDEVNNDPYIRVSVDEFDREKKLDNFIETNPYVGFRYGTHKREVEAAFADGRIPVLRVDPRGAKVFNDLFETAKYPFDNAYLHHIFVIPPTLEELIDRLSSRDHDPKLVEKRVSQAQADLPFLVNAHYLLVSHKGEVGSAANSLISHLESLHSSF